jgi:hypothetical protein
MLPTRTCNNGGEDSARRAVERRHDVRPRHDATRQVRHGECGQERLVVLHIQTIHLGENQHSISKSTDQPIDRDIHRDINNISVYARCVHVKHGNTNEPLLASWRQRARRRSAI